MVRSCPVSTFPSCLAVFSQPCGQCWNLGRRGVNSRRPLPYFSRNSLSSLWKTPLSQEIDGNRASFAPGKHEIEVTIPRIPLTPGLYSLALSVLDRENVDVYAKIRNLAFVRIEPLKNAADIGVSSLVHLPGHWRVR